jgi:hypothetical protein
MPDPVIQCLSHARSLRGRQGCSGTGILVEELSSGVPDRVAVHEQRIPQATRVAEAEKSKQEGR